MNICLRHEQEKEREVELTKPNNSMENIWNCNGIGLQNSSICSSTNSFVEEGRFSMMEGDIYLCDRL